MANGRESSTVALIENEDDTTTNNLAGSSGALYRYKRDLFYFLDLCGVAHCWNHHLERLCGSDEEDQAKIQWRFGVLLRAYKGEVASFKTTQERKSPRGQPQPKRAKDDHSEVPILWPQNVDARQNEAGINENHNARASYGPTPIPQEPVSPNEKQPFKKLPTYNFSEKELDLREAWDAVIKSAKVLLQDDEAEFSRRRTRLDKIYMNKRSEISYEETRRTRPNLTKYKY